VRATRKRAGTPAVTVIHGLLPEDLLASLQMYVRVLPGSPYMGFDSDSRRFTRHNDPVLTLVHRQLVPTVRRLIGKPIKQTYVYLAVYAHHGVLAAHVDRPQCQYTLDLCLEDSGGDGPWPLYVDGEAVLLSANDAVLYRGCEQTHWRDVMPEGKTVKLAFFHFVDRTFSGTLD
jgi:hypothetical protein